MSDPESIKAILNVPYTVEDLVSELKLVAANNYDITRVWDFIKERATKVLTGLDQDSTVTLDDINMTNVFSLLRLTWECVPVGYEGKTNKDVIKDILSDKYFTESELNVLCGGLEQPSAASDEPFSLENTMAELIALAKENPHANKFTFDELLVCFNTMQEYSTKLGGSQDLGEILTHIMGTPYFNVDRIKETQMLPYIYFMVGFLPDGFNTIEEVAAKLPRRKPESE